MTVTHHDVVRGMQEQRHSILTLSLDTFWRNYYRNIYIIQTDLLSVNAAAMKFFLLHLGNFPKYFTLVKNDVQFITAKILIQIKVM